MNTFKTIIVGVDGREGGRDALALAGLLQRSLGSKLIAVHAYPDSFFVGHGADPVHEAAVRDDSFALVSRDLEDAGLQATTVMIDDDSAGRALHDVAESRAADLIVVGSDRHGPLGRVLPGDVTASTLHASPCAVAVAPRGYSEQEHEIRTIGVGFDGSPEAEMALEAAVATAQATGARLDVTRVVQLAVPIGGWAPGTAMVVVETERTMHKEAKEQVAQVIERIGVDAVGHTLGGAAHTELARLSERVDLLVVGSRSYGPLRRLLLGSTSSKLVREAACPVIALPRGAAETEDVLAGASVAGSDT